MNTSTKQRRQNREIYFDEQAYTTEKFVVPFISKFHEIKKSSRILEIGCGEGGNLKYFVNFPCQVVGVDLNEIQLNRAKEFIKSKCNTNENVQLLFKNIYDVSEDEIGGKFDVIMMRDVIEHIPNQELFMEYLKKFLKPEGKIFFGFPPWQMPFGGHQQGCKSILKKTPYFHLLPNFLYKATLKLFKESDYAIDSLMEIKSTGISIDRFENILRKKNYKIDKKITYLINPNYEVKFKLKPRVQFSLLAKIPYFRNFVSTCAYYIVSLK